ncbi:hypothetical protein QFZ22_004607 [Streptomyces canus]|uniref:DUF5937 domain-containing protein n=1 Tax=Streptomyces canus TaxID=58343 RepID=A0AAW8FFR1_9ACTN|nr:hypothetical protein [Streptomyces canus]
MRIDIAGLRPERVAVVPSPLAELGMALHALAEPGHHPGLQAWVTGVTARLDPHLADADVRGGLPVADDVLGPVHALRRHRGPDHAPRGLHRRGSGPARQADGRTVRGRGAGVHLRAAVFLARPQCALRRRVAPACPGAGRGPRTAAGGVRRAAAGRPAADPGLVPAVRGGLRRGVLRGHLGAPAPPTRGGRPPHDGPAAPQGPRGGPHRGVAGGHARRGGGPHHGRQAGHRTQRHGGGRSTADPHEPGPAAPERPALVRLATRPALPRRLPRARLPAFGRAG